MARSGRVVGTAASSASRVTRRGDDLVPRVGEQPRQTLAEQGGVLGDHDAHGSTASTRVPRPEPATAAPARGRDPVGEAGEARTGAGLRAAAAVVADRTCNVPAAA